MLLPGFYVLYSKDFLILTHYLVSFCNTVYQPCNSFFIANSHDLNRKPIACTSQRLKTICRYRTPARTIYVRVSYGPVRNRSCVESEFIRQPFEFVRQPYDFANFATVLRFCPTVIRIRPTAVPRSLDTRVVWFKTCALDRWHCEFVRRSHGCRTYSFGSSGSSRNPPCNVATDRTSLLQGFAFGKKVKI